MRRPLHAAIRAVLLGMALAVLTVPAGGVEPLPLRTEFMMELALDLEEPQTIGDTPLGGRRVFYVKGGTFEGPALLGTALPGGGDWALVRKDGIAALDVRLTLRTADGALIYVTYRGISNIAPELRQRIMKGEAIDPAAYYFRIAPTFETASPKYAWLNGLVAVGVGRRTPDGVVYSVYALK